MSLKQKHHVFQFHMWCLFTIFFKMLVKTVIGRGCCLQWLAPPTEKVYYYTDSTQCLCVVVIQREAFALLTSYSAVY